MKMLFSKNLIFLFTILILLQNSAFAIVQHVTLRSLADKEKDFAYAFLLKNYYKFDFYLEKGFIRFPKDIRIAYFDLDDDGEKELFLCIRGAACGTSGCDLEIFKKVEGNWKSIGTEKSYDNGLVILDKKDNGYREIWAAERLIRWRDGGYD